MTEGNPYLSVVATSRNDDHGGDLLRRMQIFLDGLLQQCQRHGVDAELILVEWNPPPDRPPLAEALRWPADPPPGRVRIIDVPSARHRRFRHADALPLFQMIAKNVGIRRARGRFVLATNVDILFSDELMRFLAARDLDPARMYRIDRHDVMPDVPLPANLDEQLAYCRSHLLRVHTRDGSLGLNSDGSRGPASPRRPLPLRLLRAARQTLRKRRPGPGPVPLHLNGCGDFTLLSREKWHELRGYPELQIFSFNLDSVLCHAAHHAGARENVLPEPMRIYHMEHSTGSGWTPEGEDTLFESLAARGIPWLDHDGLLDWAAEMNRYEAPMIFNGESWGLAGEDVLETAPSPEPLREKAEASAHSG
jgi:hypothetical protein